MMPVNKGSRQAAELTSPLAGIWLAMRSLLCVLESVSVVTSGCRIAFDRKLINPTFGAANCLRSDVISLATTRFIQTVTANNKVGDYNPSFMI